MTLMTDKPNAFTAGPTLSWSSPGHKRPDLTPRKSGINLGESLTQAERAARGAISQSRDDVINRWKKRTKRS